MRKISLEVPDNPSDKWLENATVAEYLAYLLYKNGLTASDASLNLGYKSPNILTTILSGRMKLPIERIYDFAHELRADPYLLRNKVFRENFPLYFKEEQRHFPTKRVYPLSKQIMELATDEGLLYGALNEEEKNILKEAFKQIKGLRKEKK